MTIHINGEEHAWGSTTIKVSDILRLSGWSVADGQPKVRWIWHGDKQSPDLLMEPGFRYDGVEDGDRFTIE